MTVATPQLAQELHMFGNGKRNIINGSEWWINPDLTQNERKANFNARQIRRDGRGRTNHKLLDFV